MCLVCCMCALQDDGYVDKMEMYFQVPAYNMIRLAAWDSTALLGMWDLDEFLILPKNKAWSDLLDSGCLGMALAQEHEATFPVSWVILPGNASRDIGVLAKHGTISNALLQMPVQHIPYSNCYLTCKTMIVPSAPWSFFVHGSMLRHGGNPLHCESGRLMHFVSMWRRRKPWHNKGEAQVFDSSLFDLRACGKL